MPWFKAQAGEAIKSAEVWIHDQIGEDWWSGNGTTAKGFIDAVESLGELSDITLRINSPGGSVYDGLTIFNYLRNHNANVKVIVEGQAASIASVIAMAGDEVVMGVGTNMMVHNPWTWAAGNADAFRKVADDLDVITKGLLDAYAFKTGKDHESLQALLDAETYLTAEDAVAMGFADRQDVELKAAACMDMAMVKVQAQFSAKLKAQDYEISALKRINGELEEKNKALMDQIQPPAAANPIDVIDLCDKAGVAPVATSLIKRGEPLEKVKAYLVRAKNLKSACDTLQINPDGAIDVMDDDTKLVAYIANEYAAKLDLAQDNNLSPGAGTVQAKAPNAKAVYSQINKQ